MYICINKVCSVNTPPEMVQYIALLLFEGLNFSSGPLCVEFIHSLHVYTQAV